MTTRQKGILYSVAGGLLIAGSLFVTNLVWAQKVDKQDYADHLSEDRLKWFKDSVEKEGILRLVIDTRRISIQIKCNPTMKPSPNDPDCK